jgi:hypothetical protein
MDESKISDEILEMIKSRSKKSPEEKIRVIISLDEGAFLEDAMRDLTKRGLEIDKAVPGPVPFVSGSIPISGVSGIAAIPAVKKVERDSVVYALLLMSLKASHLEIFAIYPQVLQKVAPLQSTMP